MRCLVVVLLTAMLGFGAGLSASEEKVPSEKTTLRLRALPNVAVKPARIFLSGFLSGDRDLERYICPEVEWRFGDGERSILSPDCRSLEDEGDTAIDRLWSTHHSYRWSGVYDVMLILRNDGRAVATATTQVVVR
jgi:hypothetical protein